MSTQLQLPGQQFWTVNQAIPKGIAVSLNPSNQFKLPVVYSAEGLPIGVTMNSSGVFSGTPIEIQLSTLVSVEVVDANGNKDTGEFSVIVTDDNADSADTVSGIHIDFQLPLCAAFSEVPAIPSVGTLVSGASATQSALYPNGNQAGSRLVELPTDGTSFKAPNYIISDKAGSATVVDGFGDTLTDFPLTGSEQQIEITSISALVTATKVWGAY